LRCVSPEPVAAVRVRTPQGKYPVAPRKATVKCAYERFWHLMDRHSLDVAQVATLLSELNIGMSVLENRERMLVTSR